MNQVASRASRRTLATAVAKMKVSAQAPAASRAFHNVSEPAFAVQAWHRQIGSRNSSSYHQLEDDRVLEGLEAQPGSQLRTCCVMSPKAGQQEQEISWDEDYDEYNLHIPPHQVQNRCQPVHEEEELATLRDNDLFGLHGDESTPGYTWNVAPTNDLLSLSSYDEYTSNMMCEAELALDL